MSRSARLIVAVAIVTSGIAGPAEAADPERPGELGPYLILPEWGPLPGGRVVTPDGTAALTFPSNWQAAALTEERKADYLAIHPDAENVYRLSVLEVVAETIGIDPHEQCMLSAFPDTGGRTIDEMAPDVAKAIGLPVSNAQMVELPSGRAAHYRFTDTVNNPERFAGPATLFSSMFATKHGGRVLILTCSAFQVPEDDWLSIASTLEWVGPPPSQEPLHLPPAGGR